MKLRRLTIHNIASIADATIDFDSGPLADAGLFLISGPTGAGKSTILDAICLALYNQTPRMEKAPNESRAVIKVEEELRNDTRQMLRRGTAEAAVTLTFQGNDGLEYRAEWSVRRARNKVNGTLQNERRCLTRLADETPFTRKSEIDACIAEAIGLDFKQFCRTVMLAQGDFTRFLNADPSEKAVILEKITRVEVYSDISREIFRRHGEARDAYETTLARAEAIRALTPEEEQQLQKDIAEATDSVAAAAKARALVETHIRHREELQRAEDEIVAARKAADEARDKANAPDITSRRRTVEQWMATIEPRAHLQAARKAAKAAKRKRAELAKLYPDIAAHSRLLDERRAAKATADSDVSRLTLLAEVSPEERDRLSRAPEVRLAASLLSVARSSLDKAEAKLSRLTAEAAKVTADIETTAKSLTTLTAAAKAARKVYDELKDSVDTFAVRARHELHEGSVCPVCRQKVTVMPPMEASIRAEVDRIKRLSDEAEEERKTGERKLTALRDRLDALNTDQLPEARSEKEHQSRECETQQGALEVLGVQPARLADLKALIAEAEEMTARNNTLIKTDSLLAEARNRFDTLAREITEGEETLAKILTLCTLPDGVTPSHTPRKAKWSSLLADVKSLADALERLTREEAESRALLDAFLAPRADCFTEAMLIALDEHKQLFIERENAELGKIAEAVKSTRHDLADRLMRRRRMLRRHLEPLPDSPLSLDGRLAEAEAACTAANELRSTLTARLTAGNELRDEKARLTAEAEKLKRTYEDWSRLNTLYGSADGAKLRRIAQSMVLASLIDKANSYMATLGPRYSLSVEPGTFAIIVIDAWQGGVRRPVSTVSGGESFLVSLALALALSDIGSELAVDILFIDEGFGTLSSDALAGALDTLNTLRRRTSRRVGIISHVAGLRERIDARIDVAREGLTGPAHITVTHP